MKHIMKHIKHLDVIAFAEVCALVMAVIGFFSGIVLGIIMFSVPGAMAPEIAQQGPVFILTQALTLIIALPLIYFVFGFLIGLLIAWLYNKLAKHGFGLKFEIEELRNSSEKSEKSSTSSKEHDEHGEKKKK